MTIQGKINRPDFYVTTDIRATSDPLWQHLVKFRRRLMEGGTYTPADWHSLLLDIRFGAHDAGLRPHFGRVEWIAASLSEAQDGDPSGEWDLEPDSWSKFVLTAHGETGWIQRYDLLDGFDAASDGCSSDHMRLRAIEWAESWMNARERQLCERNILPSSVGGAGAVAQPATIQADISDPNMLHPGDSLLRYLGDQPDGMVAVRELPPQLRDPSALTVSDADGLIEFGRRSHCFVGPANELRIESGWNFGSITGPDCKPMSAFISEVINFKGDERIRQHVRIAAQGHVRAARLAAGLASHRGAKQPVATGSDWREVQRRLLELYDRGEQWTSIKKLAKRLGCSPATVQKAVKPSHSTLDRLDKAARGEAYSVACKLAGWQARSRSARHGPRATSITEPVMDSAVQEREASPSRGAESGDADIIFARLLEEAKPQQRAKLNAMSEEQKSELVELVLDDPEAYARILDRRA